MEHSALSIGLAAVLGASCAAVTSIVRHKPVARDALTAGALSAVATGVFLGAKAAISYSGRPVSRMQESTVAGGFTGFLLGMGRANPRVGAVCAVGGMCLSAAGQSLYDYERDRLLRQEQGQRAEHAVVQGLEKLASVFRMPQWYHDIDTIVEDVDELTGETVSRRLLDHREYLLKRELAMEVAKLRKLQQQLEHLERRAY